MKWNPKDWIKSVLLTVIGILDSQTYWLTWRSALHSDELWGESIPHLFQMLRERAKTYGQLRGVKLGEVQRMRLGHAPALRSPHHRTNLRDLTITTIEVPKIS